MYPERIHWMEFRNHLTGNETDNFCSETDNHYYDVKTLTQ